MDGCREGKSKKVTDLSTDRSVRLFITTEEESHRAAKLQRDAPPSARNFSRSASRYGSRHMGAWIDCLSASVLSEPAVDSRNSGRSEISVDKRRKAAAVFAHSSRE